MCTSPSLYFFLFPFWTLIFLSQMDAGRLVFLTETNHCKCPILWFLDKGVPPLRMLNRNNPPSILEDDHNGQLSLSLSLRVYILKQLSQKFSLNLGPSQGELSVCVSPWGTGNTAGRVAATPCQTLSPPSNLHMSLGHICTILIYLFVTLRANFMFLRLSLSHILSCCPEQLRIHTACEL